MAKRMREKSAFRAENKDTRPKAQANYIRISPSKVRIVLDVIRGKKVAEAVAMLESTPKIACEVLVKLINSATANAEHNMGLAKSDLFVAEIFANGGPILKRVMPRAQGRAFRINKRTSHITVILDTVKEVK